MPIPHTIAAHRINIDYHYTDDDGDGTMSIITLEVLSDPADPFSEIVLDQQTTNPGDVPQDIAPANHFLAEKNETPKPENDIEDNKETAKARQDLLEYMMRNDGSVVCKVCGEILQSRTHWYRHKYKVHVTPPLNPAPLFQCEQCLVYFKSRKGYIGHLASRHSDVLSDASPVLTNAQAEAIAIETVPVQTIQEVKEEPDPELSIPKTSVLNYQTSVVKPTSAKAVETKRLSRGSKDIINNKEDWEKRRSREEKLVADIIKRVRRECEAQGSGGAARRGYSRRTTVMHT